MTGAAVPLAAEAGAPDVALAERLFAELSQRTGTSRGVTRPSYGLGEQIAHDILRREARRLGLATASDAACNLYLTLPGRSRAPAILIGSHLDSVPRGGNFDGAAGVLLGLAVVSGFRRDGVVPPRDVTVMAIRAEESTWFGASYIGSRAAFGRLRAEELDTVRRSGDGVVLGAAIAAAGGDPEALRRGEAHLDPARIGVFLEPHIEQGPVLVARDLAVGIVTSIRGSIRHRAARCVGAYAHSGTTPREARHDAVRAVARLVTEMDELWLRLADAGHDLSVTFGQVTTDPDEAAFSKVAGRVSFSVDIRSASADTLALLRAEFDRLVSVIAEREEVQFELGPLTDSAPALMSPAVIADLAVAADKLGIPAATMPCGAGHDAAIFAQNGVPTGMVFLRNANGSHNPEESLEIGDFAAGARIVSRFCLSLPDRPA